MTARRKANIAADVSRPTVRTGRWYSSDFLISSSEYQSFGSAWKGRHGVMVGAPATVPMRRILADATMSSFEHRRRDVEATDMRGEASVTISAPPEKVYATISDVTVLGSMSPECQSCDWLEQGKQFQGHNKIGGMEWTTVCDVVTAEPGREFAFQAGAPEEKYTEWRYVMEPTDGGGTKLTESFQVLLTPAALAGADDERLLGRQQMLIDAAQQTLEKLKAHIEASA